MDNESVERIWIDPARPKLHWTDYAFEGGVEFTRARLQGSDDAEMVEQFANSNEFRSHVWAGVGETRVALLGLAGRIRALASSAPKCVKCGHVGEVNSLGMCYAEIKVEGGFSICGHKCKLAPQSVSSAPKEEKMEVRTYATANEFLDDYNREAAVSSAPVSEPQELDELVKEIFEVVSAPYWEDRAAEVAKMIRSYCSSAATPPSPEGEK